MRFAPNEDNADREHDHRGRPNRTETGFQIVAVTLP
jgi:hypothetical protein